MVFEVIMNDIKGESQNSAAQHEGRADTWGTVPSAHGNGLPRCPDAQAHRHSLPTTGILVSLWHVEPC